MNNEIFKNISRIIERDSKVSTYKFALLRGTIDIVQDNSPYITKKGSRVHIPTGLLVEKWLIYYYPLLESSNVIPQNFGKANLAFEADFKALITAYVTQNGLSSFYRDLTQSRFDLETSVLLKKLVQNLQKTITSMPMKYIGTSVNGKHYSVFQKEASPIPYTANEINRNIIIQRSGWFSIPIEYYEAFRMIGSFIGGTDSILFKWAEFSVRAEGGNLKIESVLQRILQSPITDRDSEQSKKLYREILQRTGKVDCVWTGKSIATYHVDHVIPFSIWRNNDLWNLLPASGQVNSKKRDKIPTPSLIDNCSDRIFRYWNRIEEALPERFDREIQISLIGDGAQSDWRDVAIHQLKERCNYLIENRGFEAWNG